MKNERRERLNKTFKVFFNQYEFFRGVCLISSIVIFLYLLKLPIKTILYFVLFFIVALTVSKLFHWIHLSKFNVEIKDDRILIKRNNFIQRQIQLNKITRVILEKFEDCSFFIITFKDKTSYKMVKLCLLNFKESNKLREKLEGRLLDLSKKNIFEIIYETSKFDKK